MAAALAVGSCPAGPEVDQKIYRYRNATAAKIRRKSLLRLGFGWSR
jgi:hypothetical protein